MPSSGSLPLTFSASLLSVTECAGNKLDSGHGRVFLHSGEGQSNNKNMGQATYQVKWVQGVWQKQRVKEFPGGVGFGGKFEND